MEERLIRDVIKEIDATDHEDDEAKAKAIISLVVEQLSQQITENIPTYHLELYTEEGIVWGLRLATRIMAGATIDFAQESSNCSYSVMNKATSSS